MLFINKLNIMKLKFSLLLATILIVFSSFTSLNNDSKKITIVLDAGHGGHDIGSIQNGLTEKDFTLEIVKLVKAKNKNANIEIILTRDEDKMVALADRSAFINQVNPKFFISVHLNRATNSTLNGNEVYHSKDNQDAKKIAEKFYNSIDNPLNKRGVKVGNFHILRETNVPGFLYEVGFVSNENDYNYITSEKGKDKIVTEILNFINQQ